MCPHVSHLPIDRICHISREQAGTHRHHAEQLHDIEIILAGVSLDSIPNLTSIDVCSPRGLVEELDLVSRLFTHLSAIRGWSELISCMNLLV